MVVGAGGDEEELLGDAARLDFLLGGFLGEDHANHRAVGLFDAVGGVVQLEDQIRKSIIRNPINGTVLTKYAEQDEVVTAGKAIYKIADLSSLLLRAYISGDQLTSVKLGQKVKITVDDVKGGSKNYEGVLEWVSDKAEFTPKTIQTKDERANLVYAIKIKVKNDGFLKIGMYGEVNFN